MNIMPVSLNNNIKLRSGFSFDEFGTWSKYGRLVILSLNGLRTTRSGSGIECFYDLPIQRTRPLVDSFADAGSNTHLRLYGTIGGKTMNCHCTSQNVATWGYAVYLTDL